MLSLRNQQSENFSSNIFHLDIRCRLGVGLFLTEEAAFFLIKSRKGTFLCIHDFVKITLTCEYPCNHSCSILCYVPNSENKKNCRLKGIYYSKFHSYFIEYLY